MGRRPDLGFDLPVDLPVLIGRHDEIQNLSRVVERCRMVTITGPSGIGKTRVAIEVARRIQQSHRSRAALVELAAVGEPSLVAQSAAAALGFEPQPGRDPLDALITEMSPLTILLVLDNCEHIVGAAAELVDRLLAECDGVSVLATSQVPLGVSAEQRRELPPLSVPEAAISSPEEAIANSDAVALFCARAVAANRAFVLTDDALPAVIEICRRLEGIPLAIELAAARAGVMGPADIADHLIQRLSLLSTGARRTAPRHQTIRAAIDWSYGLLSAPEAMLLRRLSVFVGSASTTAISDVCTGQGISTSDVGGLMDALVARSLATAAEASGEHRFRLAETIRAYATARLDETGEASAVRRRHALWCAERAELLAGRDDNEEDWASDLEVDHDNLRAALAWSVEADTVVGLRLAVALIGFWQSHGYFGEGQRWLGRVLEAAAMAGPGVVILPALRAEALWGLGMVAMVRGDVRTARSAGERALSLAREADLASLETRAQNLLAFISVLTQDAVAAKPVLEAAAADARSSRDAVALMGSLAMLGRAHLFLGEIDESREVFEELLRLGGGRSADTAMFGLGRTALAAGREALAQERFEAVLPRLREVGDPLLVALGLSYLGELAWARGDMSTARALLQEGLDQAQAMGAPYPTARCLCLLAQLTGAEGDLAGAMGQVERACSVASAAHLPYALVRCLHVRGFLKRAAGDLEGARDDYEAALDSATSIGDRQGRAASLRHLAGVLRVYGDENEAAGLLKEAIGIEADIGGGGLASALEALAAVVSDQGRPELAATLLGGAEAIRASDGPLRRPDEIPGYETDLADLRGDLGPRQLESAWARGSQMMPTEVVTLALAEASEEPSGSDLWATLTKSERRIAAMVALGRSSREIGEELGISERTVQGHVGRALAKLHLASRRELKDLRVPEDDEGSAT